MKPICIYKLKLLLPYPFHTFIYVCLCIYVYTFSTHILDLLMFLIFFISPAGDFEISVTALSGSLQYGVLSPTDTAYMVKDNMFNEFNEYLQYLRGFTKCETKKSSRYDKLNVTEKLPCLQNCESCLDVTEPSSTRL